MSLWTRVREVWRDPNPIVRKELLAALRTPLYVRSVVGVLVALAALMVLSAVSVADEPDTTEAGRVLFQLFFGATYLAIAVVGPTLGAMSIVHERETRTWDAMVLSGMRPWQIVWGKLLAVFAAVLFIPLASLPMLSVVALFGGVSGAQIAIAGAYTLVLGALAVSMGVAVSAQSVATRRALLVTTPLAVFGSMALGGVLAAVGHDVARRHALTLDGPFFFADAYLALPFDRTYFVYLVLLPAWVIGVPFWGFHALARSGLMDPTEDRTWPLKRWALGALGLGVAAIAIATRLLGVTLRARQAWSVAVMSVATPLALVLLFMFVTEPLRPTRRMQLDPPRGPLVSRLRPTLAPSVRFVVVVFGATLLACPVVLEASGRELLLLGAWCAAFVAGVAGVMGWLAARAKTPARGATAARVYGVVTLFVACVGVWIVAALAGAMSDPLRRPFALLGVAPTWLGPAALDVFLSSHRAPTREALTALYTGIGVWSAVGAAGLAAMHRAARR